MKDNVNKLNCTIYLRIGNDREYDNPKLNGISLRLQNTITRLYNQSLLDKGKIINRKQDKGKVVFKNNSFGYLADVSRFR